MALKVDFFESVYQRELPRRDSVFGINDGVQESGEETYSLCDGMLSRGLEFLAFVELKVRQGDWIQHNIEQLESAIKLFCENHDYRAFKHREAYAANRKHPSYHYSHKVQMNEFHSRTKFRLLIQNTIIVR